MPRITDSWTGHVVIDSNDLRGRDLAGTEAMYCDLTGCLRNPEDVRIPGWSVAEGRLYRQCQHEPWSCRNHIPAEAFNHGCRACSEHCVQEHTVCQRCSRHVERVNYCNDCSVCYGCCTAHPRCRYCERRPQHDHGTEFSCGYCESHCSCGRTETEPGKPWPAPKKSSFPSTRLVGVEWEFNTTCKPFKKWSKKWRGGLHSDGSCGWEAVTAPMAGDNIRACLRDLGALFKENGVESDHRCGIHVHVDAGDLNWRDMYRMIRVYERIEPALYILGGANRPRNSYCLPCGSRFAEALKDKDDPRAELLFRVAGSNYASNHSDARDWYDGLRSKKHGDRYRGLNLVPWLHAKRRKRSDATIEFRIHENTLDADRVASWAELLALVVDWAHTHNANALDKLPKSPLRALCAIAPSKREWIIERTRAWRAQTAPLGSANTVRPVTRPIRVTENYRFAA